MALNVFHQFNLLKMVSPTAYQGLNKAFGYVPPEQALAHLGQQLEHHQVYRQMLEQNGQAFARARLTQRLPAQLRRSLGPDPDVHQLGNVTVMMSKDGKTLATDGPNAHEVLGALTALKSRFAEGAVERAKIDESIADITARIEARR